MVVSDPEGYKRKKDEEKRLSVPDEERKELLWTEMRKEPLAVITLALMYAKNFQETGEDVTKRWITAEQQAEALERYYNKGYNTGYGDGIQKGREYERNKIEKVEKKRKKDREPFNDGSAYVLSRDNFIRRS